MCTLPGLQVCWKTQGEYAAHPQVTFNNTMTQYYSQLSWSACSHFQAKVQFNLEQQGLGAHVQLVGNDTLFLEGTHIIPQNITDITTGQVGRLQFS